MMYDEFEQYPLPPARPPGDHRSHRMRKGVVIGAAAVVALVAGVGLGHVVWAGTGTSPSVSAVHAVNPSSSPSSSSSGSGSSSPSSSPSSSSSGSSSSGGSGSSSSSASSGPTDVSSIADKVDPGLVDIDTTLGYQDEEAAGTGIVLTSSGEILTNNHVIEGATSISVTDIGNGKTYAASVVGYDTTADIAMLQLSDAWGLQTATIATASDVAVGEDIVGIGNAGGTGGTPSAAGGTVTAIDQSITASDEGSDLSEQLTGLIETNADIQPGDSGGSLVNSSGQVIGMDTAASDGYSFESSSQSSGIEAYAIPINEATSIAKAIEAGASSSTIHIGATGFLGVEVSSSSDGSGGYQGANAGASTSGATVAGVVTGSPAQTLGLAQGDIITSVDGQSIDSAQALSDALETDHPGSTVTIGWTDTSGQSEAASVQLSSGPPA